MALLAFISVADLIQIASPRLDASLSHRMQSIFWLIRISELPENEKEPSRQERRERQSQQPCQQYGANHLPARLAIGDADAEEGCDTLKLSLAPLA
jgi:hypothetical protein